MGFEKLRPYQIEDANFLAQLDACACFNEQRTGKTPIALKVVEMKQLQRIVIVCPATMIYPWVTAIREWSGKSATAYIGTPEQRKTALMNWSFALVASYDTIKRLTKDKQVEIYDLLSRKPDGIILDEAQRIGKHNTDRNKAICKIGTKIPFRMALSGSPAMSMSNDIYGILHFLYPNTFSSYWKFTYQFYKVGKGYGYGQKEYNIVGDIKDEMIPVLQGILNRISTQRKRKDVMRWLPDKDRSLVKLPPTPAQTRYLSELQQYFETEDLVTAGILDRIIRYRQICVDPELVGLKGSSPKTNWIMEYLSDYQDTPTLIFSRFTVYLKKLAELTGFPVICGETPLELRAQYIDEFQKGIHNVLLLNIVTCKEGITLDRAEVEIFTDKYPPVGDIEQAEDRFVATTLDKADKAHTVYDLMMEGTYEEDIQRMLIYRKEETDIVNDYKNKCERKGSK